MVVVANLLLVGMLLALMIYPKYLLSINYLKGKNSLEDTKVKISVGTRIKYSIPMLNNYLLCKDLGLKFTGGFTVISIVVFLLNLLVRVIGYLVWTENAFLVFITIILAYLGIVLILLADILFLFQMGKYFDHGFTKWFCFCAPLATYALAQNIHKYFRDNKDYLKGTFDAQQT